MHRPVRFAALSAPLLALVAVSVLLGAAVAAPPASASDVEDVRSSVDDALLALKVKARLLDELGAGAFGIDVEVVGSTVILTGTVDERPTQELAEEVALAVHGVRSVRNKVALEKPEKEASSDTPVSEEVAKGMSKAEREVRDAVVEVRVKRRLIEEIGRHALDLEVEASDGVVTLRGRLPDRERERLALRTARKTRGVDKVIDLIDS